MIKLKNKLTIKIQDDDIDENPDEKQFKEIKCQALSLAKEYFTNESNSSNKKNYDTNASIFQTIKSLDVVSLLDYMEGKNKIHDVSYKWINELKEVNLLSKSLVFSPKSWDILVKSKDFQKEFKLLKLMTEDEVHKQSFIQMSKSILNDNRYKDILPFSYNNPLLNEGCSFNLEKNYINASYLNGGPLEKDQNMFIATQGPLKKTVSKFWKLVIQKGVYNIIMLCKEYEDLRTKCEIYWPTDKDTPLLIDDLSICLSKILENKELGIVIRTIKIYKDQLELREIKHLQLTNWPDHMIPSNDKSINYIIDFIDIGKNFGPIIVHCSAGNGRTGTLIAIYNIYQCLNLIKQINIEYQQTIKPFFSVFNICRKLREQRQGMITSCDQYKYIYEYCALFVKNNFF